MLCYIKLVYLYASLDKNNTKVQLLRICERNGMYMLHQGLHLVPCRKTIICFNIAAPRAITNLTAEQCVRPLKSQHAIMPASSLRLLDWSHHAGPRSLRGITHFCQIRLSWIARQDLWREHRWMVRLSNSDDQCLRLVQMNVVTCRLITEPWMNPQGVFCLYKC